MEIQNEKWTTISDASKYLELSERGDGLRSCKKGIANWLENQQEIEWFNFQRLCIWWDIWMDEYVNYFYIFVELGLPVGCKSVVQCTLNLHSRHWSIFFISQIQILSISVKCLFKVAHVHIRSENSLESNWNWNVQNTLKAFSLESKHVQQGGSIYDHKSAIVQKRWECLIETRMSSFYVVHTGCCKATCVLFDYWVDSLFPAVDTWRELKSTLTSNRLTEHFNRFLERFTTTHRVN